MYSQFFNKMKGKRFLSGTSTNKAAKKKSIFKPLLFTGFLGVAAFGAFNWKKTREYVYGTSRFLVAGVVAATIIADYKISLAGYEKKPVEEQNKIKSVVHQRSADRLVWLCRLVSTFRTKKKDNYSNLA